MKSLCVKTNNSLAIHYLLEQFEAMDIPDTYISFKEFHHFQNIILHCVDESYTTPFIHAISNIVTKAVLLFFENDIIKNVISLNYFYFSGLEKNKIFEQCMKLLNNQEDSSARYDMINNKLFEYISTHHSLFLQGFLDFRLPDYQTFMNEKVDLAVNQFIIDKEYTEFINILRLYIRSESAASNTPHLHLIYRHHHSVIINDEKEIVACNDNIAKAKYISDISFSSNDLALNTLLNLLPKRITVHLVDSYPDEFINTLELIFQDRVTLCENCDICDLYRFQKIEP